MAQARSTVDRLDKDHHGENGPGNGLGKAATSGHTDGMVGDLREFINSHPAGWTHEDWVGLLAELRRSGHSTDPDEVGRLLELERLVARLKAVPGVDEEHVRRITERYITIWELRDSDDETVSLLAKIPREEVGRIRFSLNDPHV